MPIETLKQFNKAFPDDAACARYLYRLRWPEGFTCPRCGAEGKWMKSARQLLRCANGHQVSVTSGTALHRTKQPLWNWFHAAFAISTSTAGLSALQLQKQLGLTRYETAYMLMQKIRRFIVNPLRSPLRGTVEIDEMYVGGVEPGRPGRGALKKALVVAAVEVIPYQDKKGKQRTRAGRIRMKIIPNAQAKTLVPWVSKNVEPGSTLVVDAHAGYTPLSGAYELEEHISSHGDYLPMSGLIASNFKARMSGIYHGAFSKKHLQAYLNEYVYRFNRRFTRGASFERCLSLLLASTDSLEYTDLYRVGTEGHPSHPNPSSPKTRRAR